MKKGILAAGNFIVDTVKIIDTWPTQDSLCNILSQYSSNGGGPYNILKDLGLMKAEFPLIAMGCIGDDALGEYIVNDCKKHGIIVDYLHMSSDIPTSFTDVMTVKSDGRRTFFHNRGANAKLSVQHFNFNKIHIKIFHLAYLMLLDSLDILDDTGKTGASTVFQIAKNAGLITSADIVSENSGRYKETIACSLPYIDYLFVNEYEAEKITDISTSLKDRIDLQGCQKAGKALLDMGVNKWVILHYPNGAIALSKEGEIITQSSLTLPQGYIKGTVGAGDAFAAGCLYGIHENWNMQKCLQLAVSAAAACLSQATSSDGLVTIQELWQLYDKYKYN